MNKDIINIKRSAAIILLFMAAIFLRAKAAVANSLVNSTRMATSDIDITVELGYKGQYKTGRSTKVDAVINNKGSAFTGKFRVEYSKHGINRNMMTQEVFTVEAGKKKRILFAIPEVDAGLDIKLVLLDENNKEICKRYVNVSYDSLSSQLYIGALSDRPDSINYISNEFLEDDEVSFFWLESSDITSDVKIIDALDVIIIDGFDVKKLSKGQVGALKDWTSDGGTLVFGSDTNADKVLKAFASDFLKGSKKELISAVPYKKGNVLVMEFENEELKLYGRLIVDTIKKNLSDNRKKYIGQKISYLWDSYRDADYYAEWTSLLNETDSLPNLALYAVILIIYTLLAAPVSYIIAKKKDKRILLWVTIPFLAVVFSMTIYLIGTSTRIQNPYINYASTIELPEKAKSPNKVNTFFSITSPSNKSYEALLPYSSDILTASVYNRRSYILRPSGLGIDKGDFGYGIEYSSKNIKLIMNKLSAFESVYFTMNNKSSSTGTVEINTVKKDGKLSGTISNKMSCNLKDCIFYDKGKMYYIGDFLVGTTFEISNIPKNNIYDESKYSFNFEKQLGDALGGTFDDGCTSNAIKRKYTMILRFINYNISSASWFYGFVADGSETGFTSILNYDKYGETGVYKMLNIPEKINGYDIIGSLENYAYDYDSSQTNGCYVYDDADKKLEVKYKFPENFILKKIIYNKDTAAGGEYNLASDSDGYADYVFAGRAKVLDKDTGKYVTLLESAKETEIDNIEKYLEDDGSLIIYYDIESSQYVGSSVSTLTLPRTSLAGQYIN